MGTVTGNSDRVNLVRAEQIPRDDVWGIWSEGLNFLENMVLPQGIWSGQRHGEI